MPAAPSCHELILTPPPIPTWQLLPIWSIMILSPLFWYIDKVTFRPHQLAVDPANRTIVDNVGISQQDFAYLAAAMFLFMEVGNIYMLKFIIPATSIGYNITTIFQGLLTRGIGQSGLDRDVHQRKYICCQTIATLGVPVPYWVRNVSYRHWWQRNLHSPSLIGVAILSKQGSKRRGCH